MSKLKDVLRNVAPALAGLVGLGVGGPAGPLAAAALGAASKALLGRPDGTEEEVAAAVGTMTPEQRVELVKANNDFAVSMESLRIKDRENEFADTANAREMHMKNQAHFTYHLAYLIIGGFFVMGAIAVYVIAHLSKTDPQAAIAIASLVGSLVGYASAKADTVVGFFYGSSVSNRNNAEERQHMIQIMKKAVGDKE